jgi:hypothetical protein
VEEEMDKVVEGDSDDDDDGGVLDDDDDKANAVGVSGDKQTIAIQPKQQITIRFQKND